MAARQSRRGDGGGGGVVLAVVMVLIILGLIAGYIPVVLAFDPYVRTTEDLNEMIEANVYQPLLEGGVPVRKAEVTAERRSPFDQDVMDAARRHIELGVDFDKLAEAIGWDGERALSEIQEMLADAEDLDLRPDTVREYVQELRLALRQAQDRISSLASDLETARSEAETAAEQLDAAKTEIRELEERAQRDIVAEREKKEEEIQTLARSNDRLNEHLESAREEARRVTEELRQARAEWGEKEEDLRRTVSRLEDRLAEEFPPEVVPTEGHVQSADMIREYAIVGLGEEHGMRLGDTVTIYRLGRGGIRIQKATGRVVSVQRLISRVDLFDLDREYPVIEGDLVVPDRAEQNANSQ